MQEINYSALQALIAEASTAVGETWAVTGMVGESFTVPETGGDRTLTQDYALEAEKLGSIPVHREQASSVAQLVVQTEAYDA